MTLLELAKLEEQYRKSPNDASTQLKIVEMLRTEKIRRPDLVIACGPNLLEKHRGKLGSAQWDVREQVFSAALDLHYFSVAKAQLEALVIRFPASTRVKVLEGMWMEAKACSSTLSQPQAAGFAEKALEIYDDIIEEDPFNATARKRRACVQKGSGTPQDLAAAARCINEYIDLYPQDFEAWKELSDIYLEQQQLEHAKKALEEVVMLQAVNYVNHLKLADVLYSLDDLPLARKYYAQSLELNRDSNPRAALGMVLCTSGISSKAKGKSDATNVKLYQIGRQLLLDKLAPGTKEAAVFKKWLNDDDKSTKKS